MAKLNPFLLRRLVFITLAAATFCFVIAIGWHANHATHQAMRVTDSTPQTLPVIPIPPEISLHPVEGEIGKHNVPEAEESQRSFTNPKVDSLSESPFASSQPDSVTSPSRLNPSIPRDNLTALGQAVSSTQVDGVISQIVVGGHIAKTFSVPSEYQSKVAERVKLVGQEKLIALTFDDGPWPRTTSKVLEILEKNNIKATFFWVGQNLKDHPEIGQKVVAAGHAIGNHTWHHWYRHMDSATAAHEIDDTAELIYKMTGVITFLFRPPGGLLNNGVADYAKEKKYGVVMWSVDPMDYRPLSAQKLFNNVIRKAQPGTIVLMHDGGGNHAETVKALPDIIAKLKELGYNFVTVPELLAMKGIQESGVMAKKQLSEPSSSPITQP